MNITDMQSMGEAALDAVHKLESGKRYINFPPSEKIESPLERAFWHEASKCKAEVAECDAQVQCGRYRVDALIKTLEGRSIAVELDGASYHDEEADWERDKEILFGRFVDEIIRIPFAAMWYFGRATFCVLAQWHPMFTLKKPSSVFSGIEYDNERTLVQEEIAESGGDAGYLHIRDWEKEVGDGYEVFWELNNSYARVGGPRQYELSKVGDSGTRPIRRFVYHEATEFRRERIHGWRIA